jgi:hypothetical protein
MLDSLLDRLARQCGVGDAYLNYRGDPMLISRASRKAILAAMGRPVEDAAEIERVLGEMESEKWLSMLPPVAVARPGSAGVTIAVGADALEHLLHWRIALESERHGCQVVGEELGTVPPEMSLAMAERSRPSSPTTCRRYRATGRPATSHCASASRCIRARMFARRSNTSVAGTVLRCWQRSVPRGSSPGQARPRLAHTATHFPARSTSTWREVPPHWLRCRPRISSE